MDGLRAQRGINYWNLIAVIFVIIVVALVMFPVFVRGGHQRSKQSICQQNLKQLAIAMIMYAQDNDEHFPACRRMDAEGKITNVIGWDEALLPYIKSKKTFKCPVDKWKKSENSYALNARLISVRGNNSKGLEIKEISEPDQVVMIFDGNTGRKDIKIGHGMVADRIKMVSKKYNPQNTFAMKHNEGDNFAFVDGHVRWISTRNLAQGAPVEKFTWITNPDLSCLNVSFLPDFSSTGKP